MSFANSREGHISHRNFPTPAYNKIPPFFGILSASADGTFIGKLTSPINQTGLEPGRVTRTPIHCNVTGIVNGLSFCDTLMVVYITCLGRQDENQMSRIPNTSLPARAHDSDSYVCQIPVSRRLPLLSIRAWSPALPASGARQRLP